VTPATPWIDIDSRRSTDRPLFETDRVDILDLMTDTKKFTGVSVRTAGEVDDRIDRLVTELSRRSAGIAPKRNTVAREALLRGLEVLERELGVGGA
jgi:uncharacterized small protein (DUF1192 family)